MSWERDLSLEIPVDEYGRKLYSPHHVNLFKNIKKHITLGRTIQEIRQLISLPPLENSRPKETVAMPQKPASITPMVEEAVQQAHAKVIQKSPYASVPKRPVTAGGTGGAANVINLVQKLNKEKDQLYKKLLETEKLNSHLYSANTLFHKKVRDMSQQIVKLRETYNENEKFKLLEDKARLHKQLIDVEKLSQYKQEEILNHKMANEDLRKQIKGLENKINPMNAAFDAS